MITSNIIFNDFQYKKIKNRIFTIMKPPIFKRGINNLQYVNSKKSIPNLMEDKLCKFNILS